MYCGMVFSFEDMLLLHIMSRHKQNTMSKQPLDLSAKQTTAQKRSIQNVVLPSSNSLPPEAYRRDIYASIAACRSSRTNQLAQLTTASQILAALANSRAASQSTYARPSSNSSALTVCKVEPRSPPPSVSGSDVQVDSTSPSSTSRDTFTPPVSGLPQTQSFSFNQSASSTVASPFEEPAENTDKRQRLMSPEVLDFSQQEATNSTNYHTRTLCNSRQSVQAALLSSTDTLFFCVHCNIIFLDKAMYNLHSGLHNCNFPLQCNICGKECSNSLEFSAHIIHT